MRKKFLKAAIATFTSSLMAAFGFMFVKPAADTTDASAATTTTVVQSFECGAYAFAGETYANGYLTVDNKTQGDNAVFVYAPAQWFELHVSLNGANIDDYASFKFDFYSPVDFMVNSPGTSKTYAAGAVTHTLTAADVKAKAVDGVLPFVMMSQAGQKFTIDNVRGVKADGTEVVINGFETKMPLGGVTGVGMTCYAGSNVTHGKFSAGIETTTEWFEVYVPLTIEDITKCTTLSFDYAMVGGCAMYTPVDHTKNITESGTYTLDLTNETVKSAYVDGYLVMVFCGTRGNTLFIDNFTLTGEATSGGDQGGNQGGNQGGTTVAPTDVLQDFETVSVNTGATVSNVTTSTSHVTQGSYSNAVSTSAQWFELQIQLDKTDFSGYSAVELDYHLAGSSLVFYYGGAQHVAGQSGTYSFPIDVFEGSVQNGVFTVVCVSSLNADTLYVDNLRGVTTSSGGGTGGADAPSASGNLINDFENGNYAYTVNTDGVTKNGVLSTTGVTQGSHSVELTSSTAWYNVYVAVGNKTLAQLKAYATISFSVYSSAASNWHIQHIVVGSLAAGQSATVSFDVETLANNSAAFVPGASGNYIMFVVQGAANVPVYLDNMQVSGTGSNGGNNQGTATGKTQYTQFNSALNTSEWKASSGSVSGGVFNANWAPQSYLASVGTYNDFVLEFDVKGLTVANSLIVGFGAGDTIDYGTSKYVQHNTDGMVPSNIAGGVRTWSGFSYGEGVTGHFRLEVKGGVVYAGYSINGGTMTTASMGEALVTGRVFISVNATANFQIDNLVLINSEDYKDYAVNKKANPSYTTQVTAGTTVTGKVDLGDMANKTAKFIPSTKGLVMNETTGEWSLTAPLVNGGHTYFYNVVVVDLVIDGWIYPLGSAGEYTLMGTLNINVMGGTQGDVEGGSGDTSMMPSLGADETGKREVLKGTKEAIVFSIDLKTKDITKISWLRNSESGILESTKAYTFDHDMKTVTLTAEYMAALPEGKTQYTVYTVKGSVKVEVTIVAYAAPTTSTSSKTVNQFASSDVSYTVNLNGETLLGIQVARDGIAGQELKDTAYTFSGTTLKIKGAYVATLPAGTTTFTVNTAGGSVSVKLIVNGVALPTVSGTASQAIKVGENKNLTFTVNVSGQTIKAILVQRTGEADKALATSAYTFSGSTLTLKAAYVKNLPVGNTSFVVETVAGKSTTPIVVVVSARLAPVVNGDAQLTVSAGTEEDQYYAIDLKGETLNGISVSRDGVNNTQLTASAYEYDATYGELIIFGDYVAQLPTGTTTFTINTTGGSVSVKLTVSGVSTQAPTVSGSASKTVKQYSKDPVVFNFSLNGGSFEAVAVKSGNTWTKLNSDAYSITGGKVTLTGNYVSSLAVGTTTFVFGTNNGNVQFTLTVEAVEKPVVSGTSTKTVDQYTNEDQSFTVDLKNESLLGVQVSRKNVEGQELMNSAYTMSNGTFTLLGDYVAALPVGTTTFTLNTIGGSVSVSITVDAIAVPVVSGNVNATEKEGTQKALAFSVVADAKGFAVIVKRSGQEDQQLKESAYTFNGSVLTLTADYVMNLPVGTTTFVVENVAGQAATSIVVKITARAPELTGLNAVKIQENSSTSAQFYIEIFGATGMVVEQKTASSKTLTENVDYKYSNGRLVLNETFTNTLALGKHEFNLKTEGNEPIVFYVEVIEKEQVDTTLPDPEQPDDGETDPEEPAPEQPPVSGGGSSEGSGNLWDPNFDWDNWTGDIAPDVSVVPGANADGKSGCGSSIGAISGLALIGAAVVALVAKKKQD